MADNNEFIIDKLVLDIEVKDGNSKEESSAKKVRSLATAISLLDRTVKGFDSTKMGNMFKTLTTSLKPFANELKGVGQELIAFSRVMNTSVSKSLGDLKKLSVKMKILEGGGIVKNANANLRPASVSSATNIGSFSPVMKIVSRDTKEVGNTADKTTKSLDKMLKSFIRIAGYRTIRVVLKELSSGILDTFKAISQLDPAFNSTMSNITSSIDMLKTSLGVGLYQTLAVLEPLITGLTNIIVTFANSMAKVGAVMKGQGTYLKINTDYLKEYASAMQGVLLPFDEFTTLGSSGGIDYNELLKPEEVGDVEKFTRLEKVLHDLGNAFKDVWNDIIKPIWDGLQKFFGWLNKNDILVGFLGTVLGLVLAIKAPIALLAGAIAYFASAWSELSRFMKVGIPVFATTLALLAGLVAVLTGGGWGTAIVAGIITGAMALVGATALELSKIKNYRFGGDYQSADMFYANENGRTELIASNNTGGGSVMTMDMWGQISEVAFYNALVRYDACQNGNNGSVISINGLGKAIASSSGFTNEINRRNPSLNLV